MSTQQGSRAEIILTTWFRFLIKNSHQSHHFSHLHQGKFRHNSRQSKVKRLGPIYIKYITVASPALQGVPDGHQDALYGRLTVLLNLPRQSITTGIKLWKNSYYIKRDCVQLQLVSKKGRRMKGCQLRLMHLQYFKA